MPIMYIGFRARAGGWVFANGSCMVCLGLYGRSFQRLLKQANEKRQRTGLERL